jgi:hypothetical protein
METDLAAWAGSSSVRRDCTWKAEEPVADSFR